MVSHLKHAEFYFQQNRMEEAEREIRKELAENPNNDYALALLSSCCLQRKKKTEALKWAEQAFGLAPNSTFNVLTLARCYYVNQNMDKARWAVDEGLKLNPNEVTFYFLLALIAFYEENWQEALNTVEQGLQIDPEEVNLINLRGQALIKLNRKSEAASTLDFALSRAPEDTISHSNKGWISIEQDKYDEAVNHFQEALRLDPENNYARTGLKEAIKGKNFLYRMVLKYFLWMGKLQQKGQWAVIIGAYILYRGVLAMYNNFPSLAWLFVSIIAFYITFVFAGWIGRPFSNIFLRFHPIGRKALNKDELVGANIVGGLAFLALLFWGASLWATPEQGEGLFFWLFILTGCMLIPVGGIFAVTPRTKTRRGLVLYTVLLAAVGVIYTLLPIDLLLYLFLIGFIAYQFVANYLMARDARVILRSLED